MPRKGQLIKGAWLICKFCNKKYWAQNCRIKKWNPKFCNEDCRNKGVSKAYKQKTKIKELYLNKEWSISKIDKFLSIGGRESITNLLKKEGIAIRPKKFYLVTERNPNFKGGYITPAGYRRIGKEMEHRKVMRQFLGRELLKEEHVHHLNGNKLDNRIDNLALLTRKIHGGTSAKQYTDWKEMYHQRIDYLEHKLNGFC